MEPTAAERIKQRMAELPEDVRAAIGAADLGERIRKVGEKYALHIDQQGELGDETLLAMLGFVPLETFGTRLSQVLRIAPEQANALATDLGVEIFNPIRNSMKAFAAAPPAAMPKAEAMLAEKTVQTLDPYREPV